MLLKRNRSLYIHVICQLILTCEFVCKCLTEWNTKDTLVSELVGIKDFLQLRRFPRSHVRDNKGSWLVYIKFNILRVGNYVSQFAKVGWFYAFDAFLENLRWNWEIYLLLGIQRLCVFKFYNYRFVYTQLPRFVGEAIDRNVM